MDSAFENLSLLEKEVKELVLELDIHPNFVHIVEFSIVGRFLTNQQINLGIMKSGMVMLYLSIPSRPRCEEGDGWFVVDFSEPSPYCALIEDGGTPFSGPFESSEILNSNLWSASGIFFGKYQEGVWKFCWQNS
ncbi:hypothetical protein ACS0TY_019126 [Phlomoides rotata]